MLDLYNKAPEPTDPEFIYPETPSNCLFAVRRAETEALLAERAKDAEDAA